MNRIFIIVDVDVDADADVFGAILVFPFLPVSPSLFQPRFFLRLRRSPPHPEIPSEIQEIKRSRRPTYRNVISVYVSSFKHTGERSLCFRERAQISGAMPAQDSFQVDRFLLPVCITVRDRDEEGRISKL